MKNIKEILDKYPWHLISDWFILIMYVHFFKFANWDHQSQSIKVKYFIDTFDNTLNNDNIKNKKILHYIEVFTLRILI